MGTLGYLSKLKQTKSIQEENMYVVPSLTQVSVKFALVDQKLLLCLHTPGHQLFGCYWWLLSEIEINVDNQETTWSAQTDELHDEMIGKVVAIVGSNIISSQKPIDYLQ